MTNLEKIKSMTVKEMAEWLEIILNDEHENWDSIGCWDCITYGTHHYPKDCGNCEFLGGLELWLNRETQL